MSIEVLSEDTAGGSSPSVSRLILGSHTGTHVDPPAHYFPDQVTVDRLSLEALIGPAWVAYLPGAGPISAVDLEAAGVPVEVRRVLLRTRNSERHGERGFDPDFVGLNGDAAAWLLGRKVVLVGIDGPSIEPFESPGEPVHRALLGSGVIVVEGLALGEVESGPYQLICLPLPIAGGDGAPARAVLMR